MKQHQQSSVLLNMIASGLSAPAQSAAGIAAATAAPALSYGIGQYFKELAAQNAGGKPTAQQQSAHLIAHAALGAAVAAAGGSNPLAGAAAAGTAEAAAPLLGKWLYGKENGSDLTAEEKTTVAAITNLLGTAAAGTIGGSSTAAASGSLNAQSAVENNALETAWDVANIGIGTASLTYNISHENYGSAALDAAGLIYDGTAAFIPFLPAGASAAIKAKRAGNSLKESVKIGHDITKIANAAHKAAKNPANKAASAPITGSKIHRNTAKTLGEYNGVAFKLSDSAASYAKGANKATGKQPDWSWRETKIWADLTTQGQWKKHVRDYSPTFGEGIPVIYKYGKGITTINGVNFRLNSGAGLMNGTKSSIYIIHDNNIGE